jgi:hypothetical protein
LQDVDPGFQEDWYPGVLGGRLSATCPAAPVLVPPPLPPPKCPGPNPPGLDVAAGVRFLFREQKTGAQSTATHSRAAGRRARKFGRGVSGQTSRRRWAISSDAPPFFARIRNLSDFGGFQSPEVRGKDVKTFQISMVGFQCVAKIEKRRINFLNLFHAWFIIARYGLIFLGKIATFSTSSYGRLPLWLQKKRLCATGDWRVQQNCPPTEQVQ